MGGGVAIAIKRGVPHSVIDDFVDDVLAITLETAHGPLTIAACYRPPSQDYLPMLDLHRLASLNHPVYLLGDFNARHRLFGYTGNTNGVGRQMARLVGCGEWSFLGPHFKTFYGHNGATTPDIVLCNRHAHLNSYISPGPPTASDHVPVSLTLSTNPIAIPTAAKRYDYANANWDEFKTATIQHLADNPLNLDGRPSEDVEAALETWYQAVEVGKNAAMRQKRFRTVPHPFTSDTLTTLRTMLQHLVALGDAQGWGPGLYHRQKQLQRELLEECQRLSSQKWEELIDGIASDVRDPAKFWAQVNKVRGEKTRTSTYLRDPGVPGPLELRVSDDVGKERVMRDFWSTVFQISPEENLDFDLDHERVVLQELERREDDLNPHLIVDLSRLDAANELIRPFDAQDIRRIINNFKNRKAPGKSGIAKRDLLHLPVQALTYLADIFNACLSAGYFPRKFKSAVLIFIPKSGDPHNPAKYRPISLLEVPGKILERGLNERVSAYVEDLGDQGFNPLQYGFRERRGTGRAIAVTYELISTLAAKPKGRINLVTRDLEKAFDKVWHQGLRHRLLELQFPDLITRILSCFLHQRTARIRMGSVLGDPIPLLSGVPQGSVLSPTLFILYTADTPPPDVHNTYMSFADDHNQICVHHGGGRNPRYSALTHTHRTSTAITSQNQYHRKKKIRDNTDKLKVLPCRRYDPPPLEVEEEIIPYARDTKLLGLRLTRRGFTRQVTHNRGVASATLSKLRRFSRFRPHLKLRLYKTLVRPQLEYPAVPLHVAKPSRVQQLQSVQNNALRWVHGARWPAPPLSAVVLHRNYRVEPLNQRLWRLARRIWERLLEARDPMLWRIDYQEAGIPEGARDHSWWPRSRPHALGPRPDPVYVRGHAEVRNPQ